MNIKPYDTAIQQLFLSAFYKVPRFQRPYSWEKDNIEDLWSDVVESRKSGHFIGSMVLYSSKGRGDLFIVDGQQRLTTITIFLAALRDTMQLEGQHSQARGVQGLIERQDINSNLRFVLKSETSFPFFQEYVQKLGKPDIEIEPSAEESEIQSAYTFARQGFQKIVTECKQKALGESRKQRAVSEMLEQLRDALLSIKAIIIQLDNESDAYVVFETLNTRGKDLEPKDLVKTLLTKLLPAKSADVDTTRIKWERMIREISGSSARIDASKYIHHFWLSRYDYTSERTLFEKIKTKIGRHEALAFLNSLVGGVTDYRKIFEPEDIKWRKEEERIKRSLLALNVFRVRQPTPLILSVLRSLKEKEISLKQAGSVLTVIERFHFINTAVVGQSSSGGVSKMYAAAARILSEESNAQKRARHLQDFRKKLLEKDPDEVVFTAGFIELRYSEEDSRDRQLVRYILEKADRMLRKDSAIDYARMTIEHIAPQRPRHGRKKESMYSSVGNLLLVPCSSINGLEIKLSQTKSLF